MIKSGVPIFDGMSEADELNMIDHFFTMAYMRMLLP